MKKLIISVIICLAVVQSVWATDAIKTVSDGKVTIDVQLENVQEDIPVTITVVDAKIDWLNKDTMLSADFADIAYMDRGTVDENGMCKFVFYLDNGGKYNVYIGVDGIEVADALTLYFTKTSEHLTAVNTIKNATSTNDIYNALIDDNSEIDLLLYNDIFSTVKGDSSQPLSYASQYIYDYISENDIEDKDLSNIIYNSVAVCIANGITEIELDDVDNYKDVLHINELGLMEYYDEELSGYYTNRLKSRSYTSIKDYNSGIIEAVLLSNIQYGDSQSLLKDMLIGFKDEIGIKSSDVTDDLVRNIIGNDFESTKAVKEFVDAYNGDSSESIPSNRPSYSSNGGGGGSRTPANMNNVVIDDAYDKGVVDTNERSIFNDLEGYTWAEDYIIALFEQGIINGKSQGMFCPSDYVTREEFIKMIVKIYELNVVGNGMKFTDVSEDDWYYPYVECAYYAGIINGISENVFGAGQYITRQDLAVIADRASYIAGVELAEKNDVIAFDDFSEIGEYAVDSVGKLQKAGIINGDENGNFKPNGAANRAEAAKIIYLLSLACQ